jgi:predicted ATPase/DNA-binding SARP family transcriptional activator
MLSIGLLGATEISEGHVWLPVPPPMPRALLALLSLRAGAPIHVEAVVDALWGEAPPDSARNAIQVYVSALRKLLGHEAIRSGSGGYALDPAIRVDAVELEQAVGEYLHGPVGGTSIDGVCEAMERWRGEPLSDVTAPFVETQRVRLVELHLAAVDIWASAELRAGRYAEVARTLQDLVGQHPLHEPLAAHLVTALGRSGRQADAMTAYQRIRRLLREELGADPGEDLQRAYELVLRSAQRVAPLRPLAQVPAPRSGLIGRDEDVAGVRTLLARPGVRLVTVVGPGGVGKTRLVLEVLQAERPASQANRREVVWVSLAGVADAGTLLAALAAGLGVREQPGQNTATALTAVMRPRSLLLVLDNIEQLLPEAARDLAILLDGCPQLTLLVTSRVATRITGEHRVVLDPLPVGRDATTGMASAATALLLDRAHAIRSGWASQPEALLCAAGLAADLDGLPLALELAAARATLLGPCALRERLRGRLTSLKSAMLDTAQRHRSLEAAITWSFDLLPTPTRMFLTQLAVFRGAFSVEAAMAVGELDEDTAYDQLGTLVDASLLQLTDADPAAFVMLDTIRAFAEAQLNVRDDAHAVRIRHAEFFADLARSAGAPLWSPEQQRWFGIMERNHDNLRSALEYLLASRSEAGLELAATLAAYWETRGNTSEALTFLTQALDRLPAAGPALRANAMFFASRLCKQRLELTDARLWLESSLELYRQIGDVHGEIFALARMGAATSLLEKSDEAMVLGLQSVELARRVADPWYLGMALNNHSATRVGLGDDSDATEAVIAESQRLFRDLHEGRGVAMTLGNLADLHLLRRDYEAAGRDLEEMLALSTELGLADLTCTALNLQAVRSIELDDPAQARTQLHQSLELAYSHAYWDVVAEALLGVAAVAVLEHFPERALRFAVVAQRRVSSEGGGLTALQSRVRGRVDVAVKQHLDAETTDALRAAAAAMTVDHAVAEALATAD